ncbi:hypothetical protein B0J13DRAFT_589420 [Dactylonectria estremocensis]|uniref:Uncharacterized protein n=1 Tax=Dactylonectria estremocensis TaxID=1079267 RepID=A0A9P9DM84_9HYPO|nr:hypothetical protein B0J13DRAFT_589420 [Dactylonectria estremocensis]
MSFQTVPTYYSAPNFSIPPPEANGPLQLGSVITDLKEPIPLNPENVVPVPESEIVRSHLNGFSTTIKDSRNLSLGILAKLLGLDWFKTGPKINRDQSQEEHIFVKRLDTQYFSPSHEYMSASINLHPVKAFRLACRDRLPVFLITGIKVANGASANFVKAKAMGANMQLSVMASLPGLPVVEPQIGGQWNSEQGMSFEGSSDFVLAYRVTRMKWKKGEVNAKSYTLGATMVDDHGSISQPSGIKFSRSQGHPS